MLNLHPYLILILAIVSEVIGSSLLKIADGFKNKVASLGVAIAMIFAFYCLSLAIETIPLSIAYAIWSGLGTLLTALVGVFIYKESLDYKKISGLFMIVSGVFVLTFAI